MSKYLLTFLFSLTFIIAVQAQTNYSNVKVDELSDTQIRQLIQRAESIGYGDAQLEQMAKSQGMPDVEVLKLRKRVEQIRSKESSSGTSNNRTNKSKSFGPSRFSNTDSLVNVDRQPTKKELIDKAFDDLQPKIFGSELFRNTNITFEPNLRLATPPNYVIGPDDQLLVDLSGDNEASYDLKVSPEGNIRVEYAGNINVGGLTVNQAISKIRARLNATYPSLRSGRTQLAVNLGNVRSIKVIINGQVVKPGTYTLSSFSSVFNALNAAGGPNQNGSYRKIQVIRGSKVITTIDVYDFLINGIDKGNIRLQDQDLVNVPVYDTRVQVVGEVKTPAIFEVKKGETFQNLLNYAGGFSSEAYRERVKVFQNTNKERQITDIASENYSTYQPNDGDKFFVDPILDRFTNRVEISGAVFRPGYYELNEALTLKQLIAKADGVTENAFLNRGYINRLNADQTPNLISFDVSKIISGQVADIPLKREDRITISSIFDLRDEYKITVQGEVRQPDQFVYADNMTVEGAIQLAGGFKEGATPSRIEISRRIKDSDINSASAKTANVFTIGVDRNLSLLTDTFKLQPFDIISVRSDQSYVVQRQVKIEGEVLHPGTYTITSKNDRISDLVKRAGGLTPLAYTDGASLRRPGKDTTLFKSQRDSLANAKAINKLRYGSDSVDNDGKVNQERRAEERSRIVALQRVTQSGVDTTAYSKQPTIISSDLVGINLTKILDKPGKGFDLLLEDGDIIKVPNQLQTVKVSGEVLNPNNIVYSSGKSFKSYVTGAGGFTANALKGRAYIRYANGSVAGASRFLFFNSYPRVKPGAEILVPKRAEREKLSAAALIGLGTGIASLAAIVVSLLR